MGDNGKQLLPAGFIYLKDLDPTIQQDVKYAQSDNFLGRPVAGYVAETIIITDVAGQKLHAIQNELKPFGLGLKVFDAYRPQSACDDFWQWGHVESDIKMKHIYYPSFQNKMDLFNGYISRYSNHSRGSTVDLTLVDLTLKQDLDMGSVFDYLGELSHTESALINSDQLKNRLTLKHFMDKHGFKGYWREWWHFELIDEPFKRKPEDHFNFEVK